MVADSVPLKVVEETGFPFRDEVNFTLSLSETASFPFHLRIPAWTKDAQIMINGRAWEGQTDNQTAVIQREWKDGDQITLTMPMELKTSQWYEFAHTIERGPLVYALKIREKRTTKDRGDGYRAFEEVYPLDDWNYALYQEDLNKLPEAVEVVQKDWDGEYPWNLENAPVELKMRGMKIPEWKLVNGAPEFPAWWGGRVGDESKLEEITLIPYGCTTLRITEFPVYR